MPILKPGSCIHAASSIILLALVQTSQAEPQPTSHVCAEVPSPAQRLACYDQQYPPSPQAQEKFHSITRDAFGLETDAAKVRNPLADSNTNPDEINESLARLDYSGNKRIFTLASGQVWIQTDSVSSGHVDKGDNVRIRRATFGSYMLVTPNGVALRVKRKK